MNRMLICLLLAGVMGYSAAQIQDPLPPPEPGMAADENPAGGRPWLKRRPEGDTGNRGVDPATRELLEQVMIARMSRELALDDEQTVLLVRRFSEFREQIRERQRRRAEMARDLHDELRKSKDNADIQAKLEVLMAFDAETEQLRRGVFDAAGADLTPWQRARLYLFVGEFESEMRNLLQQARERYRWGQDYGAASGGAMRGRMGAPGRSFPGANYRERRPSPYDQRRRPPRDAVTPEAAPAPPKPETPEAP